MILLITHTHTHTHNFSLSLLFTEQFMRSQQFHQEYISRHLSKQESTYIS